MIIRQETQSDYNEVYDVIKLAFSSADHADGNEQDLVVALRKCDEFIPELSLVAVVDNEIIGHILFTKILLGDKTEIALAPLSVLPRCQRQGVGKALINEGHKIAKNLGYNFSVVLGSEKYYPKFGYTKAENFGIKAPFDVPSENFMAINFHGKSKKLDAVVQYAKEFMG